MPEGNKTNDCSEVRVLIERRMDSGEVLLDPTEKGRIERHTSDCGACRQWEAQMNDLVHAASAMPQFDVSEALTQRILAAVAEQQQSKVSSRQMIFMVTFVVGALCFLTFDSAETIGGLLSWLVGLAGVALFRSLLKSPAPQERALGHQ